MDGLTPQPITRRFLALSVLLLTSVAFLGGCTTESRLQDAPQAAAGATAEMEEEDFAFPPSPETLKLSVGQAAYTRKLPQQQNCAACHAKSFWQNPEVQRDLAYTTPIDLYLFLTHGKAPEVTLPTPQRRAVLPETHPKFGKALSRDERWAVIMYVRYLAGGMDMPAPTPRSAGADTPTVAAIFGGNCAVCHGSKGQADGPLHIGKTGNHELHDAALKHNLLPAPANFQQFNRVFNRTDAQLFKYICEGIYPSAMPAWYGNVDRDKDTGEVIFVFDDALIFNLVRYVRSLTYVDDITPEGQAPPKGLRFVDQCQPVATNRPWTSLMRENADAGRPMPARPKDVHDVTGGMTFETRKGETPVINRAPAQADEGGRTSRK